MIPTNYEAGFLIQVNPEVKNLVNKGLKGIICDDFNFMAILCVILILLWAYTFFNLSELHICKRMHEWPLS